MKENKAARTGIELTSFSLHIIAMTFMLIDHLWATVVSGNQWMTMIGRLAFPIFAFMISEGYFYTKSFKKYLLRIFVFALIAEVPYDTMHGGTWFDPFGQNVMWTYLLGILCVKLIDIVKTKSFKKMNKYLAAALTGLTVVGVCFVAYFVGLILCVDFYGHGVLTVVMFYLFRGRKWYNYILQFAGMIFLHWILFGGRYYDVILFGKTFEIVNQGIAVLALPFIWLYKGKQGPHTKPIKYCFYAFYPVHMFILGMIYMFG